MIRILVVVPFPRMPEEVRLREAQGDSANLGPDTQLTFRTVRAAPSGYLSHFDAALGDLAVLEVGLSAEEDGYDAVCVDTVSDAGVSALRSSLSIPVVSASRTMFSTALTLGRRFSILTMWDAWRWFYERTLADMSILQHCTSIRAIGMRPDSRNLLTEKLDEAMPRLMEAALACLEEDKADVICLGSTTMHQAHGQLSEQLPVPVLNPGPLSYQFAELLVRLGLSQSRAAYPTPATTDARIVSAAMKAIEQANAAQAHDRPPPTNV